MVTFSQEKVALASQNEYTTRGIAAGLEKLQYRQAYYDHTHLGGGRRSVNLNGDHVLLVVLLIVMIDKLSKK